MEIFSGSDCVSVLIGAGDIVLMLLAIYPRCPVETFYVWKTGAVPQCNNFPDLSDFYKNSRKSQHQRFLPKERIVSFSLIS